MSLTFTFGFESRSTRDGTEKEIFPIAHAYEGFIGLGVFLGWLFFALMRAKTILLLLSGALVVTRHIIFICVF